MCRYIPFVSDAVCKSWQCLKFCVIPISAIILVAIGAERYMLLCRPTHIPSKTTSNIQLAATVTVACVMGMYACSLYLSLSLSVYLSVCLPLSLCVSLSLSESLSLNLSLYLPHVRQKACDIYY